MIGYLTIGDVNRVSGAGYRHGFQYQTVGPIVLFSLVAVASAYSSTIWR